GFGIGLRTANEGNLTRAVRVDEMLDDAPHAADVFNENGWAAGNFYRNVADSLPRKLRSYLCHDVSAPCVAQGPRHHDQAVVMLVFYQLIELVATATVIVIGPEHATG